MTATRGARPQERALATCLVVLVAVATACARESEEAHNFTGRAEATASIDREEVAFGDDLTFTLEVRSDPALEVELPHASELEGFRILDAGTTRNERDGVRIERRWHRLRVDRAGALTLPALTARYRPAVPPVASSPPDGAGWTAISTEPITVEVRSLLETAPEAADIRDIKPLQPIDRGRPWLWVAAALVAVLALAAATAYWLRRRRRAEPSGPRAPPVPPDQVALAALARLAELELTGDEAVRRFYFSLSEIVRAYVEGRFGLNATDLTSEEILAAIPRLALPERAAFGLRAFLVDSDGVKFAARRPEHGEVGAILDWARRFVEETRPVDATGPDEASEDTARGAAREAA